MIKTAIIGGSGYTGSELVRLLANHPEVVITGVTSETFAGKNLSEVYPNLTGADGVKYSALKDAAGISEADIVFVALPHGESMKAVPDLLDKNKKVIDLSGDFRLADADEYSAWYKKPHTAPELLDTAVYGLPEVFGDAVKNAVLIANPGCYPTCVILAGAPLIAAGLGFPENMIADCLSGISGAGRGATAETHYCGCDESVSTYKAGGTHQHIPEMELYLGLASNQEVNITFTPHLAPFSRGIYGTVYADIKDNASLEKIHKAYTSYYAGSHFVKVLPKGEYPRLKAVAGSNFCHIGIAVDERAGRAVIVSAIDNLVKGASGQAIQNMNLMCGLPEETGLEAYGLWP